MEPERCPTCGGPKHPRISYERLSHRLRPRPEEPEEQKRPRLPEWMRRLQGKERPR